MDIMEVRIAYLGVCIPPIHRINGLRQLGAASLVDTASVNPQPLVPVSLRLLASIDYLRIALATADFILLLSIHPGKVDHLLVVNFRGVNPPM